MDMTGERRIPASRDKVWEALNDPLILKQSIPGCESLEKTSDTEFKATASVKIGPISARFTGRVALTDIHPPDGYTISGEGQGGVAGFAKGGAVVALTEDGTDTLLKYDVKAQVGGKIAQLGARLIDASAKSMAEQFFTRFAAQVAAPPPEVAPPSLADVPEPATPAKPITVPPPPPTPATISLLSMLPKEPMGFPMVAWIGSVICFVILVLIFGAYL
jgi:carbon monoxide dehydrogenase subunit G